MCSIPTYASYFFLKSVLTSVLFYTYRTYALRYVMLPLFLEVPEFTVFKILIFVWEKRTVLDLKPIILHLLLLF